MTKTIKDVMSSDLATCEAEDLVVDAAKTMRDKDIGDVIVTRNGELCGIVTDRDIVIRAVADPTHPIDDVRVGDICSADLTALAEDDSVDDAVNVMREQAVRRIPVVDGKRPVGIVSIGDLAVDRDASSVLGEVSAAPPNT